MKRIVCVWMIQIIDFIGILYVPKDYVSIKVWNYNKMFSKHKSNYNLRQLIENGI